MGVQGHGLLLWFLAVKLRVKSVLCQDLLFDFVAVSRIPLNRARRIVFVQEIDQDPAVITADVCHAIFSDKEESPICGQMIFIVKKLPS